MEKTLLTQSEGNVMNCLWEKSPQTVMDLVGELSEKVGWAKSTTITTLRRMEDKGFVKAEIQGKAKSYTPEVDRETAVMKETDSFLKRVYRGSVGLMVSTMVREQNLSEDEIRELERILEEARGERDNG